MGVRRNLEVRCDVERTNRAGGQRTEKSLPPTTNYIFGGSYIAKSSNRQIAGNAGNAGNARLAELPKEPETPENHFHRCNNSIAKGTGTGN